MKSKLYPFLISILFLSSCASKQDVIYFQEDSIKPEFSNNDYQVRYKPDDMLQIIVSAENLQSVTPFNLPVVAFQNMDGYALGQPQQQVYLVDRFGYIKFPVLGDIKVEGLTRIELIKLLKEKLDPNYVKDPVINIILMNFKITVQGDVARPGIFNIKSERLSIFEALGMAGDLNISGNRENVLIVREENNTKKEYRLNLKSKKIVDSQAYYLQQNDVIYVEPNYAKIQDASYTRSTGLFISLASVIISLLTIITR